MHLKGTHRHMTMGKVYLNSIDRFLIGHAIAIVYYLFYLIHLKILFLIKAFILFFSKI